MSDDQTRILVVEDDEVDREFIRRLLGRTYAIQEAATGHEAIAAVEAARPHLVLLDYWLPDTDSTDLLSRFIAEDIPVIVLTGEQNPRVVVTVMQQGASDYLLKSDLTREMLTLAIAAAMDKEELKRSVQAQQQQLDAQAERLAEQNEQIRSLASALTLAEQRERRRISRILHDHIQQVLYAMQMQIHLLMESLGQTVSPEATGLIAGLSGHVQDAIDVTRTLSVDLSPPILREEGVGAGLQWLSSHMERVHGLQVNLQIDCDIRLDREELHVLIFQMVQELLFNVVKHANVDKAWAHLFCEDGQHKILVEDEGEGFDSQDAVPPIWKPQQGYGLYSVRERLALFGGDLELDSFPGNGARVTITLPPLDDS